MDPFDKYSIPRPDPPEIDFYQHIRQAPNIQAIYRMVKLLWKDQPSLVSNSQLLNLLIADVEFLVCLFL